MPRRWVGRAPLAVMLAGALAGGCGGGDDSDASGCGLALCKIESGTDAGSGATDSGGGGGDGGDGGGATDGAGDAGPGGCVAVAGGDCSAADHVVDGAWLEANLAGVVVLDVRDTAAYGAGHVPGARFLDLATLMMNVGTVTNQVVDVATAEGVFQSLGLAASDTVVAYDVSGGLNAARTVWTLRYFGHADARFLDGGFARWSADGRATDTVAVMPAPSTYTVATVDAALLVDVAYVESNLGNAGVVLVDARGATEYAAGHIPGALSFDWNGNLAGGVLRPRDELVALYAAIPVTATVVAYCQSGMRASMDWLVLRWLGYPDVRLYDGSWAEWSLDPMRPVEP